MHSPNRPQACNESVVPGNRDTRETRSPYAKSSAVGVTLYGMSKNPDHTPEVGRGVDSKGRYKGALLLRVYHAGALHAVCVYIRAFCMLCVHMRASCTLCVHMRASCTLCLYMRASCTLCLYIRASCMLCVYVWASCMLCVYIRASCMLCVCVHAGKLHAVCVCTSGEGKGMPQGRGPRTACREVVPPVKGQFEVAITRTMVLHAQVHRTLEPAEGTYEPNGGGAQRMGYVCRRGVCVRLRRRCGYCVALALCTTH